MGKFKWWGTKSRAAVGVAKKQYLLGMGAGNSRNVTYVIQTKNNSETDANPVVNVPSRLN